MSTTVNKVILVGNLGADPECRPGKDGLKIVSFTLATSEMWTDKSTNEKKTKTEWHKVVIVNDRLASIAELMLKKGSKVYVEGQIQTRSWTDKTSGIEKFITEVIVPRFNGDICVIQSTPDEEEQPYIPPQKASKLSNKRSSFDLDDEIPF